MVFVHATQDRDRPKKKSARDIELINERRKTNVWWETTATKLMIYFCLKLSVWQPLWCLQIHICLRCSGCSARMYSVCLIAVCAAIFFFSIMTCLSKIKAYVCLMESLSASIFSALRLLVSPLAHSLPNTNTKNNFRYKWFQLDEWKMKKKKKTNWTVLLMFDGKTLGNAFNQCTTALMTFDLT